MCALRMVNHQIPGTNHAMTLFCQDSVLEITRYIHFLLDWSQPYHSGSLSDDDGYGGNENGNKKNRFNKQSNNFACASRFFVHFCCC